MCGRLVIVAGLAVAAAGLPRLAAAGDASSPSTVGLKITDFTLADHRGLEHKLADLADHKAIVVAFLGTECPLVQLYIPKLIKLQAELQDQGVAFLGIYSNRHDSLTEIAAHRQALGITFPTLRDPGNKVADQLGAQRTPEVFVLDAQHTVRYAGRIDDQFAVGIQRAEATHHELRDALEALLAGKPVQVAHTAAPGCLIGRQREPQSNAPVDYAQHVAPILAARCVNCHRQGEVAPFALTSYDEVVGWSEMIREVVSEGRMPPWHAHPDFGQFSNDCRLTPEERDTLCRWVDAGAPAGDLSQLKPPPAPGTGWQIGTPDVVLQVGKRPYRVPAEGIVDYVYLSTDTEFTEDKWIAAIEARPGNHRVVHHILAFIQEPGKSPGGHFGLSGYLACYVPGARIEPYPRGMAKRIPKGSRLIFQIHYTPIGTPQEDQSSLGLIFADPSEVEWEVATGAVVNPLLLIPPEVESHPVNAQRPIRNDALLLSMFPHMHLRGKAFRFTALYPDGTRETLLDVPKYDFNWQHSYLLKQAKELPKGTKLICNALFDNSPGNPANPDPSQQVIFGEQTSDEMMIGYFDAAVRRRPDDQTAAKPRDHISRE
jgi:peroxiredoxin